MILKDLIEEEAYLHKKAEEISDEITEKLNPIFKKLLNEYLKRPYFDGSHYNGFREQLGKKCFLFNRWSKLDGYRIDGDDLALHYYDYGYDCYDSAEFKIPLSVVEDELSQLGKGDETVVWYKQVLEEARQKVEEKKENKKKEKESKEYQDYLKLKEKYEK